MTSCHIRKTSRKYLHGIGRIFDFSGLYSHKVRYRYLTQDSLSSHSPLSIDTQSLQGDWQQIGQDIYTAMTDLKENHAEEK